MLEGQKKSHNSTIHVVEKNFNPAVLSSKKKYILCISP